MSRYDSVIFSRLSLLFLLPILVTWRENLRRAISISRDNRGEMLRYSLLQQWGLQFTISSEILNFPSMGSLQTRGPDVHTHLGWASVFGLSEQASREARKWRGDNGPPAS